ncbi:MAG: helix-turn-helix domain-containing protein [Phenylobacterium sp.]|jgi:excisionase family DNA binding protein|uniref:helix-turn-helix transcriptional regulator n=1 Tax=Phenylobacterium sp. TaxID=1871053 RepID=UPI003451AD39|nr:helix-turn-helix domain-containing protein [Phenylobacterium sp.]MCA6282116.1 helix-turn-helix domain-containing protein [Phenylobacterium sp.]
MSEHLLSTPTVAEITGLSQVTLRRWRTTGGGPQFVRLGRAVRYRSDDVNAFVEARTFRSTSEADVLAKEVAVR